MGHTVFLSFEYPYRSRQNLVVEKFGLQQSILYPKIVAGFHTKLRFFHSDTAPDKFDPFFT
jgi:hypothetical protein